MSQKTFVGFGFGAIQAGLFLHEAQQSGQFSNLVVAYRRDDVIASIRNNGSVFNVNVAHNDYIDVVTIGPIQIENVNVAEDRQRIIQAVAEASEIATALGSTKDYVTEDAVNGEASIHRMLAAGLRLKLESYPHIATVIYTAENDMKAAEILQENVFSFIPEDYHEELLERVQFLNSAIGKMSGTIIGAETIQKKDLHPITPDSNRAFLVESYSHILISKIKLPDFERGLNSFEEKTDLFPFEEAKLYGHNAVHALAAYLAHNLNLTYIREVQSYPVLMEFLYDAAWYESGLALVVRHQSKDDMFSEEGFKAFTEILISRMMNPFLNDTVERVGRDIPRKLGWEDRLIGTMRLALNQGIEPKRFAVGVAAALNILDTPDLNMVGRNKFKPYLKELWQRDDSESDAILELIDEAFPNLERLLLEIKES